MTISTADVLKLRDGILARAKQDEEDLTPAQVLQGLRTEVHHALQEESPPPYLMPAAAAGKTRLDFTKRAVKATRIADEGERVAALQALHQEERAHYAQRLVQMHATVPVEEHLKFQTDRPKYIQDAHHYAQHRHLAGLWEQTDKLVAEALASEGKH